MPKFYVQCGPHAVVLSADSPESAALAALDRTLQHHGWIYTDPGLDDQQCRDHLVLEALLHLDPQIRISERGFDRPDAQQIGTPETVQQWHALMVAVHRLCWAAGFSPRWLAAPSGCGFPSGYDDRRHRSPK